jgi:hypothetical protein
MNAAVFAFLVYVGLIGAAIVGWVLNVIKVVESCCDLTGMLVVRIIGIPVGPLGAVMGFL